MGEEIDDVKYGTIFGMEGERLTVPAPAWQPERVEQAKNALAAILRGDHRMLDFRSFREQIAEAANNAFPKEACGFLLSTGHVVECRNVDDAPWYRFRMEEEEAAVWWRTGFVTAVWHSHPNDPAVPSEDDEMLAPHTLAFLIYSVTDEDLGTYCWDERSGRLVLVTMEGPE
jgi:proteasome lid subunit RPN8/RPN11